MKKLYFNPKYKLLNRLIFIQICAIVCGGLLVYVAYQMVGRSAYENALTEARTSIRTDIEQQHERWRAWAELDMHDTLNDELEKFKKKYPLVNLEVVNLPNQITYSPADIFIPSLQEVNNIIPPKVVRAKIDLKLLKGTKIPNRQLMLVLALSGIFFLLIVFYSAHYIRQKIHTPMQDLIRAVELLSINGHFDPTLIRATDEMRDFVTAIDKMNKLVIRNEKAYAFEIVASQLAHDIRSPLAALSIISARAKEMPIEFRELINDVVIRIQSIAKQLLDRHRANHELDLTKLEGALIKKALHSLLTEKKLQFCNLEHLKLEFETSDSFSPRREVLLDITEFNRMISNLINNAVEALNDHRGTVKVWLDSENDYLIIKITDTGKGMKQHIIEKIGQVGLSHGKAYGSGLGLYHATKTLNDCRGKFKIDSKIDIGTSLSIFIPYTN